MRYINSFLTSDVYPFNSVRNMDKKNWWKEATHRTILVTSSNVDQIHNLAQKIIELGLKRVSANPNCEKNQRETLLLRFLFALPCAPLC